MPEGPEVETIRRTLEGRLRGLRISSIWRSSLAFRTLSDTKDFAFLVGDRIQSLSRLAKVLIIETDHERGLFVRFGMSGRLFAEPRESEPQKHTHLRIGFEKTDFELRFIDARRFGDVQPFRSAKEREQMLAKIGPDGLSLSDEQVREVARKIKQSQREIKVILLDQAVVSGVGNIYACEALFIAKVSPTKRGCDLSLRQIERVLLASKEVMLKAVENKGTTFRSYLDGNGEKGGNQQHLLVFGREGESCDVCSNVIKRIVQAGRSTFYCPSCQR